MQYLKDTLGGLSRSLTDSALHNFQGRHRWWKLALFAGLFVLPGGSLGVALLAWAEHRRGTKRAMKGSAAHADASQSVLPKESFAIEAGNVVAVAANSGTACLSTGGASCRASAGKPACKRQHQRQQTQPTEPRL
ncbi:hypothetical protein OKW43_002722 [Paraburkholderia sp. WC7.3g]|uniref:Uncharacterized protein n=1 Tax=Paraburkholderia podalyriae TaxID=1938811 RepID=A0ABR7PG19_9BURK|nr:hypothetical protein [Paraburkholderia podalyriae]MBC8745256.1 hypothetical protein [Paraburkholderia podalyriae]